MQSSCVVVFIYATARVVHIPCCRCYGMHCTTPKRDFRNPALVNIDWFFTVDIYRARQTATSFDQNWPFNTPREHKTSLKD